MRALELLTVAFATPLHLLAMLVGGTAVAVAVSGGVQGLRQLRSWA